MNDKKKLISPEEEKKEIIEEKLEWNAPEYPFWRKTTEWYTSVLIIGLAIVVASIILENVIFAILVLISIFSLLLTSSITPKEITVSLTTRGVRIGSLFYSYTILESFWINNKENPPRLYLKSRKTLVPLISIQIVEMEENNVYHYLSVYIEQEELHESVFHKAMEYLGF